MIKYLKLSFLLTIIIVCILLGFWQVDRGQEKSMLYDDYVKKSSLPPKLIVDSTDSVTQYTKVKLKGQFNNERQFLLDNKINNKKAGYEVITPVAFEDKIVLVNRGWVTNNNRQFLPNIKVDYKVSDITGYAYFYGESYQLATDHYIDDWPILIQSINIKNISKVLNKEILPFVIIMNQKQKNSYMIQEIHTKNPVLKHYMYAGQWFLFALIGIVFMVLLSRKE